MYKYNSFIRRRPVVSLEPLITCRQYKMLSEMELTTGMWRIPNLDQTQSDTFPKSVKYRYLKSDRVKIEYFVSVQL